MNMNVKNCRPWLAITAALTAFGAFAGTVGLATGTLALGDEQPAGAGAHLPGGESARRSVSSSVETAFATALKGSAGRAGGGARVVGGGHPGGRHGAEC